MIDSLNGELLEKGADHVVLDCHGVGYLVQVPASVIGELPAKGRCHLHIHYSVTVDVRSGSSDHRLFGFLDANQRQLFRRLIEVQGVSATIGMAILGARSAQDVYAAIIGGDEAMLRGIKGIGPKLAQRIIGELQGKLVPGVIGTGHSSQSAAGNTPRAEALSALVSLGVDRLKAERALHSIMNEQGMDKPVEELIKLTLKNL
ncbi:MAG: Holliday junction branch migration protein RuvA [Flavobacteriales bacterium]|nr:Holliday junction branch migration protein RuvA [Flavobacteriales bacterium]